MKKNKETGTGLQSPTKQFSVKLIIFKYVSRRIILLLSYIYIDIYIFQQTPVHHPYPHQPPTSRQNNHNFDDEYAFNDLSIGELQQALRNAK